MKLNKYSFLNQINFFTQNNVSMIDKGLVSVEIQLICRHKDRA